MGKMYAGNQPSDGEGWSQVGKCLDGDGAEWLVFSKAQKHTPDWLTYKIVANGRARNKANYWLVRNASTGQIGFSRDYVHMRSNRPELHEQVEAIMQMTITTNLDDVRRQLAGIERQVNFAASKALNDPAREVRKAIPAGLRSSLDRPTPFTASEGATFVEQIARLAREKGLR